MLSYGQPPESRTDAEASENRRSWWLFWTWLIAPHINVSAIWVGMIVIYFLDMSRLQALIGIFLGKLAFGSTGNLIVTIVMAVISDYGWFIVNSRVAVLVINALFDFPTVWRFANRAGGPGDSGAVARH